MSTCKDILVVFIIDRLISLLNCCVTLPDHP